MARKRASKSATVRKAGTTKPKVPVAPEESEIEIPDLQAMFNEAANSEVEGNPEPDNAPIPSTPSVMISASPKTPKPRTDIREVGIVVPLAEVDPTAFCKRLGINVSFSPREAKAGKQMVEGMIEKRVKLKSGKHVTTLGLALRYLLECVAEQMLPE